MYRRSKIFTIGILFAASFAFIEDTAYAQYSYAPRTGQYSRLWQGKQQQQQQPTYNQNAGSRTYYSNTAVQPPQQTSNHTMGYYESIAHTEHGRRLGRMLDVYSQGNDLGTAIDQIAERFQTQLREAQQNQGQNVANQARSGFSKAAWGAGGAGGGYSKKPWVPYAEYMASKQAGASWSPNAGYTASKKSWSQWSKKANEGYGYSQKPWAPGSAYSKKAWSPNPSYNKPWSPYSGAVTRQNNAWSPNENSWSPNPNYNKPWSPYSGTVSGQYRVSKGNVGGQTKQPWVPPNNPQYDQQQQTVSSAAPAESPGMDIDDIAIDTGAVTETEGRSKRTRKEKTTREVEAEHQTEAAVELDNLDADHELHDTGVSNTKSAETPANIVSNIQEHEEINIEK